MASGRSTTPPLDADPSGFFAFRTPLLPYDALEAWSAGLAAPSARGSREALTDALARDRAHLVGRLRDVVADPVVREALFIASPSLDDAVEAWLADPESERARGVVEIVVRYFARMCARPTPFGLFSGCSTGTLSAETRLVLPPRRAYVRHTRLDTHYLAALAEGLERAPEVRARLRVRPSSGLFPSGGQLRYAEARIDPATRDRTLHLVSVERTDYLDATLERARDGATPGELARALVDADPEVTLEEALGFVDALIDSQILVSDLAPPVTGPEPIVDVAATLRHAAAELAPHLDAAREALRAMDRAGLGLPASRYHRVAEVLAPLPAKTELPRLFQVDLFKPSPEAALGAAVLRELERAIALMVRLPRGERARNAALRRFREAFTERYEGREVPLVEALDEERGIGFESGMLGSAEPSPLLDGIHLPGARVAAGETFGAHEGWLLGELTALAREGGREWVLDEATLAARMEGSAKPAELPDAFALMASVAATSPEAMAAGDVRIHVHGVSGPSGAVLLGRFCHGDEALRRGVEAHLRAEEARRPDVIFAEVVHLPEGRLGNILCRPQLRAYEIPFLGRSGSPEAHAIPLTDLRVSVRGDRVVLRSARLGKEVIPRLTSAHNFGMAALGTYRFLCTLQHQDVDATGWSWGALANAPFLPRVRVGRVVLALARWTLGKADLAPLATKDATERFEAVQALRERLGLPRRVSLVDGDNVLPVDLDNVLSVESLVALVKARSGAVLQETFSDDGALCVEGPEGRFVHELVVPFVRHAPAARASTRSPAVTVQRAFPPGSEWLFAKLYTGTATADRVLREVVAPVVRASLEAGDADGWFFIRYGDPAWHLRVRFHGDPAALVGRVLPRLHAAAAPLFADGRLHKMQLDTYEREMERYGGDAGMPLCERIFAADSDAVLAIIGELRGDEAADARWRLTLRGMHALLVDLGLDLDARRALLTTTRDAFAAEHGMVGAFERQLGAKFRKERAAALAILAAPAPAPPGDETNAIDDGLAAIEARSAQIAPLAAALRAEAARGALTVSMDAMAASLLHMHANRLLRSEQRAQELVLYDFLARIYEGEAARARPRTRPSP